MRELRVIVTRLSKCRRCFVSWSGTEGSQGGAEEVKGLSPSEVLPLVQRLAGTLPVALHLSKRHCCSEELAAVLPPGSTVHPLEGRPRDLLEQVFDAAYPDGVACSVCGEVKPWNKFVPLPSGNSSDCRTCWNKRMVAGWYATPEAMLRSILWGNVREVLKSVNALRLGDPLPMGFADAGELLAYMRSTDLWERYEALCGAYYASGRDNKLAPSFGRIDPDKGFVPGNVALSTYAETWATRKARRRPTKVPLASKGYFYTGHFWRALWRHAGKTLWHAEFPTEELAIEFCAKAKDTLAATGGLAGYHVLTRANWPKLGWGKAAKEQKLKRMLGSEEPKEGKVREGDGEWTFKLYFRGAGGERITVFYALPTRSLAESHLRQGLADKVFGVPLKGIARKDWPLLGITDQVEFHCGPPLRYGGRVLSFCYLGVKFRAVAYDEAQEKAINDLLVADIRKNGRLTITTVNKRRPGPRHELKAFGPPKT